MSRARRDHHEATPGEAKERSPWKQLLLGIVAALAVSGTSPFWWSDLKAALFTPNPPAGEDGAAGESPPTDCAEVPEPVLREVCAVGQDCDGEDDFIELWNASTETIPLDCFAVQDLRSPGSRAGDRSHSRGNHFTLDGELPPSDVRAWRGEDLRLSLNKEGDTVFLLRLHKDGREPEDVEAVPIDANRAYYALADGELRPMSAAEAERQRPVGSFGR